ncbi:nuclear transport factor 2 family protein [Afifella sp. IM 167]|uniref:nuclear transport factor 2 family protein n=1 Tax=Afifella sp. IM 167 TaxID=2033586 RepID=UPI001CCD89BB|nr:nuclear transport factor 2 family protein [Afifella sp. IM 167]MBZ8132181.1 polyketide cyclase [Afifella sp. IM 167]
MPLPLPDPIAAYFAADAADGATVARCFTADALVIDEKQTHRGRDAIARWKKEASAKYSYVSEPVAIEEDGETIIVTARLTGNFPGSPVDLRYAFTLAGDRIARLEIAP